MKRLLIIWKLKKLAEELKRVDKSDNEKHGKFICRICKGIASKATLELIETKRTTPYVTWFHSRQERIDVINDLINELKQK